MTTEGPNGTVGAPVIDGLTVGVADPALARATRDIAEVPAVGAVH